MAGNLRRAAIFASLELNQGDMKVQRKGATQFTLECVLEKIFNRTVKVKVPHCEKLRDSPEETHGSS